MCSIIDAPQPPPLQMNSSKVISNSHCHILSKSYHTVGLKKNNYTKSK